MAQTVYSSANTQEFAFNPASAESVETLDEAIQKARDYARMMTEISGITSPESATAWDIVEELLAEKSHRSVRNSFADYCEEYPDAPEARIYDV